MGLLDDFFDGVEDFFDGVGEIVEVVSDGVSDFFDVFSTADVGEKLFAALTMPVALPTYLLCRGAVGIIESVSNDAKSKGADRYHRLSKADLQKMVNEFYKKEDPNHVPSGLRQQEAQQKAENIGIIEFYNDKKFLDFAVYEKDKLDGVIKEDEWKYV